MTQDVTLQAWYIISCQSRPVNEVFKEDGGMGLKASKKQIVRNNL